MSNIHYWEKLMFSKLNFFGKKIWRNALALKSKKVYLGKQLFWYYHLQLFFVYKTMSHISFNLFCLGDRRLLLEFLSKWGWFYRHNERLKINVQKTETRFCGWKSNDYNNMNIFLSLGNPCTFLLVKETMWKCIYNSEFTKSYRKTNYAIQNNIKLAI